MHLCIKVYFGRCLGLHRHTASSYLKELKKLNILHSIKLGRGKYFINVKLFDMSKKSYNFDIS